LDPQLPRILGDPTQLEQAFLNLALNAVQAMAQGGQLTIRSRAVRRPRKSSAPTQVMVEFRTPAKA